MRLGRLSVAVLVFLGSGAACTGGDPKPNLSTVTPPASLTSASAPSSTSASASLVPIDQVPPGRPASWVPAGVPTTAPYQEPGDKVPMFTLAMFSNNQLGALATAKYYLDARDWALALGDGKPYLVICDAAKCKHDAQIVSAYTAKGQRVHSGRQTPGAPSVVKAPAPSGASWVVQVRVAVAAGRLVDSSGRTVQTQSSKSKLVNVYLRWNGRMWRVSDEFLAG